MEAPPTWYEWDFPPEWGPEAPVNPTEIEINGKPLGTDGVMYQQLDDDVTRDITPRIKNADDYTFAVGASKHTLISQTWHPALTDTNRGRYQVGVGEEVDVFLDPPLVMTYPENPLWSASGGGLEGALITDPLAFIGSTVKFTAASNACSALVTVHVRDVDLAKGFGVLKPSGIDQATIANNYSNSYSIGLAGAGMDIAFFVAPTSVSFYRVCIMEIPGGPTNVTGSFKNGAPSHTMCGFWSAPLTPDNQFQDMAASPQPGLSPPWIAGGFDWVIPSKWQVQGDSVTNDFTQWTQSFRLLNSNGDFSTSKFGKTVTRKTNGIINEINMKTVSALLMLLAITITVLYASIILPPYNKAKPPKLPLPAAYEHAIVFLGVMTNEFHCVAANVTTTFKPEGEWYLSFYSINSNTPPKFIVVEFDGKVVLDKGFR